MGLAMVQCGHGLVAYKGTCNVASLDSLEADRLYIA